MNNNLFPFEYNYSNIGNVDGTPSNFTVVYGNNGFVTHVKKSSYNIIPTSELTNLATTFIDKGYKVNPFFHRNGEIVGLSILIGDRPSVVGDKNLKLIINVPNNGGGRGYLTIQETRLVCTNGMMRTMSSYKDINIKIPHTIDYKSSLELMKESLNSFEVLYSDVENRDVKMNEEVLERDQAMLQLNSWFYNHELPISGKEDMKFDQFRAMIARGEEIPFQNRYTQLRNSFKKEAGEYNDTLSLKLSRYTVFASVTNYLSRRLEASKSKAPKEIALQSQALKLKSFELVNI